MSFNRFTFFVQKNRYLFSGLVIFSKNQYDFINLADFFLCNKHFFYCSPLIVLCQCVYYSLGKIFHFDFCKFILGILQSLNYRLYF